MRLTRDEHMRAEGAINALDVAGVRIVELERRLAELQWREITPENLPKVGTEVLAGFQGQFCWVSFVAEVTKDGIRAPGYAEPTHWYPLPSAPARADEASK